MPQEVREYLRIHISTHGLSSKEIDAIANVATLREYNAGEIALTQGEQVAAISLIVSGQFSMCRDGTCASTIGFLGPNDLIGILPVAYGQPAAMDISATEPSRVIELKSEDAQQLMADNRGFSRNLMSRASARMTQLVMDGDGRSRRQVQRIAFLHIHSTTLAVAEQIQMRLCSLDESVGRIINDESRRCADALVKCESLNLPDDRNDLGPAIREQLAKWLDLDRIVFDIDLETIDLRLEHLRMLLSFPERIFLIVTPMCAVKILGQLRAVIQEHPEWKEKLDLIWVLDETHDLAPLNPEIRQLIRRDFKVKISSPDKAPLQRRSAPGIERIVHSLRGVQLGLALGGGAAKGMSHLGVLRAFDEAGIIIDAIAGTSVGAMMAVPYCGGYSPDNTVERFTNALTPRGIFKWIALGDAWYMLIKYRSKAWEGMLREHFFDWQLEQLLIPLSTIATDLVSAKEFVRSSGDCVKGILESINLGGISTPICRDGMALVDGGYLNNVPADTLVRDGATYVISVDVSAQIEEGFGGNTPDTPTEKMRVPRFNQVLSRIREVAQKNLSVMGGSHANFTITPNVAKVSFTDFKSTPQIAEIGYKSAIDCLPQLRRQLHQLDPQLFPISEVEVLLP